MKKVIISIFIILFLNSSTNLGVIIFKYPAKTIKSMLFSFKKVLLPTLIMSSSIFVSTPFAIWVITSPCFGIFIPSL